VKFKGSSSLHRIVVLNPKGGSGKTTLAFNLAGYIASTGRQVALVDMDSQGSSTRWLQNRAPELPHIHSISVGRDGPDESVDQDIVVPGEIDYAVIDAPAGLTGDELIDYTCGAHAILVPVLPSDLDVHAATRLISDLLLVAQVSRRNQRLGIVANRVKEHTVAYKQLSKFLNRLTIAVIGVLRDTQNYTRAASSGLCIHEMQPSRVKKDLEQWETVTRWLERCLATPLTARDHLRPAQAATKKSPGKLGAAIFIPAAAAAIALFVVGPWSWLAPDNMAIEGPATPIVAIEDISPAPIEPVEVESSGKFVRADTSSELTRNWKLNGVASIDGATVMLLRDRRDNSVRSVDAGAELDGWGVVDAGADYAVFERNGEEVRLVMKDDDTP
jgi:chromosome partitioning protein